MANISPAELIIILAFLIVLFGVGNVSRVGRQLGGAIREFRVGISGKDDLSGDIGDQEEIVGHPEERA